MYVFRKGRRIVSGVALVAGLSLSLKTLQSCITEDALLGALLRAGELESALADSAAENSESVGFITDALALRFMNRSAALNAENLLAILERLSVPETLRVSTPEGFAYYALHPAAYANLAERVLDPTRPAAIIGIRSIGSTLSAVVAAGLRVQQIPERITVRPAGHPFERQTEFNSTQQAWVSSQLSQSAQFLVVDEGPGLSGSSFLSVGEALVNAGVPRSEIIFLCSAEPKPEQLLALDAIRRWKEFKYQVTSSNFKPADAGLWIGGGEWRQLFLHNIEPSKWPASWTQMERAKFLSCDRKFIYKFSGLGHYGHCVYERAQILFAAGFAPEVAKDKGGYLRYEFVPGRPLQANACSEPVLRRMARYCAMRKTEFAIGNFVAARPDRSRWLKNYNSINLSEGRSFSCAIKTLKNDTSLLPQAYAQRSAAPSKQLLQQHLQPCRSTLPKDGALAPEVNCEIILETMCHVNAREEFGIELDLPPDFLKLEFPVLADARMLPHEWLLADSGPLLKIDGDSHGEDHFFPGACDIAWDLAGTIVEWGLDDHAAEFFLQQYSSASGDDARPRLPAYLLAYSLFRMGYCKMAAEAMRGTPEEPGLLAAYQRYRKFARQSLDAVAEHNMELHAV